MQIFFATFRFERRFDPKLVYYQVWAFCLNQLWALFYFTGCSSNTFYFSFILIYHEAVKAERCWRLRASDRNQNFSELFAIRECEDDVRIEEKEVAYLETWHFGRLQNSRKSRYNIRFFRLCAWLYENTDCSTCTYRYNEKTNLNFSKWKIPSAKDIFQSS